MKKTIHIMMLIAALTIAWGCSSDSSDGDTYNLNYSVTTTTARPNWAIDWYNNEPAPNWEEPNQNLFEHSMYIILTLPENLVPFSTDDDLMAVFINNECRSVAKASPLEDGSKVYFVNTVRGNDGVLRQYGEGQRHRQRGVLHAEILQRRTAPHLCHRWYRSVCARPHLGP